jgi:hypothetical protein
MSRFRMRVEVRSGISQRDLGSGTAPIANGTEMLQPTDSVSAMISLCYLPDGSCPPTSRMLQEVAIDCGV